MPYEWSKRATDLIEGQYHGVVLGFGVDRFMRIIALYSASIMVITATYAGVISDPMHCTFSRPIDRYIGVKSFYEATCEQQPFFCGVDDITGDPNCTVLLYEDWNIRELLTEPYLFQLIIQAILMVIPTMYWSANLGNIIRPHVEFVQEIMHKVENITRYIEVRPGARKEEEKRNRSRPVLFNDAVFLRLMVHENRIQVHLYKYYVKLFTSFEFYSLEPRVINNMLKIQQYIRVQRIKLEDNSNYLVIRYVLQHVYTGILAVVGLVFYHLYYGKVPITPIIEGPFHCYWRNYERRRFDETSDLTSGRLRFGENLVCDADGFPLFMGVFWGNTIVLSVILFTSIYALISLYVKIRRNAGYDEFEHFLENLALTDE